MSHDWTRRQFLRTLLLAGTGLGASALIRAQAAAALTEGDDAIYLPLSGSTKRVHDPVIIKEGGTYYLFSTGAGIPVRTSSDLLNWNLAFPASVFANTSDWISEKIPNQNDVWAPDISFYGGKYHLYYSVSTFGENRSVIGLATTPTLNPEDEAFGWTDAGLVLESSHSDDYNCIDPNLILDTSGTSWLAFGSFWSGIKLRKLDAATGKPSDEDRTLYALATRPEPPHAVEAPFIVYREPYYYLFVSFDFCCRGAESSYRVMVGRSETVTGPYRDRDGVSLLEGGGTQVTFPTERWRGPGHNAVVQVDDTTFIVHHAYDAENAGVSALRIAPLVWDADGWPAIGSG
jgi:arabinan endo-1,5-alpha-L-arabinosidase